QTACSFLSTQLCTLYDVQEFTKWVNDKKRLLTVKNKDGEHLGKVWFSGETLPNTNSEIWCGEVFFQANYEEDVIRQVWQYTVAERPDENYEIRRMLCEFGEKRGED